MMRAQETAKINQGERSLFPISLLLVARLLLCRRFLQKAVHKIPGKWVGNGLSRPKAKSKGEVLQDSLT